MSGTSMDGIDVALLETDGAAKMKLLGSCHLAYELPFIRLLKTAEWAIRQAKGDLVQAESIYAGAIPAYLKNALMMSKLVAIKSAINPNRKTFFNPIR